MLWYIPIQPLEERYSKQWYHLFPDEFKRQGIDYKIIGGEGLTDKIECGTFLDLNSSLYWYADQLKQIASYFREGCIKDGDVFFLADAEMFGIEGAIKYLADLNNVTVKIYAFAHAGSYTKGDFVQKCAAFAKWYESAWATIFDLIFVGSEYHKTQLVKNRLISPHKIVVTGNPYDIDGTLHKFTGIPVDTEVGQEVFHFDYLKHNRIICTNRPDPEKRPDLTLQVFESLKRKYPDWEFMVTTSRKQWGDGGIRYTARKLEDQGVITIKEGLSKIEYLTLLAESRIMTGNSIEENFGYCILESLIVDTIPIVENNFSHPELLENDERCLFMNPFHQKFLIESAMQEPFHVAQHAEQYRGSLAQIVQHIIS